MARRTPKRCKNGCGSCKITATIGNAIVDGNTLEVAPCWVRAVAFAQSDCSNRTPEEAGLTLTITDSQGNTIYDFDPNAIDDDDEGKYESGIIEYEFQGEANETYTLAVSIDCEAPTNICAECGNPPQDKVVTYTVEEQCEECPPNPVCNFTGISYGTFQNDVVVSGFSSYAETATPIPFNNGGPQYTMPPVGYRYYRYSGFDALNATVSTQVRYFDYRCDRSDILCPAGPYFEPRVVELGTVNVEYELIGSSIPSEGPADSDFKVYLVLGPVIFGNQLRALDPIAYTWIDPENGCPPIFQIPSGGTSFAPAGLDSVRLHFEQIYKSSSIAPGTSVFGSNNTIPLGKFCRNYTVDLDRPNETPLPVCNTFGSLRNMRTPCPGGVRRYGIDILDYPHNFNNDCESNFPPSYCTEPGVDSAFLDWLRPYYWGTFFSNEVLAGYDAGPKITIVVS